MTTSGTTTFNLEVDEIIEESFDKVGGEHISGTDSAKARRKLNLILLKLQNKGIPISQIDDFSQTLVSSSSTYTLTSTVDDVLHLMIRTTASNGDYSDTELNRMSLIDFNTISDKQKAGRPTQYTVYRGTGSVNITFWPVPDVSGNSIIGKVKSKIEDVTKSAGQNLDINSKYLPCIVVWLAYDLALSKENYPLDKLLLLKKEYEQCLQDVFDEDEERISFFAIPVINRIN